MLRNVLVLASLLPLLVLAACDDKPFDPYAYTKHSVTCPAINRATNENVDLKLSFVDVNRNPSEAKGTLLLVHGWPSLWSSWFKQIEEFQNDYRLVIPDIRGFGDSETPQDSRSSYSFGDHIGDLDCILKSLDIESTVCVGHDWGSQICYEAARSRPDVFKGVVGLSVPYLPALQFIPAAVLPMVSPGLAYQTFFNAQQEEAITELDSDKRRTLRATLRSLGDFLPEDFLRRNDTYMGSWQDIEIPPVSFLDQAHESYFVDSYEKHGFRYPLGFYTDENRYRNFQFADSQGNQTISNPVLSFLPDGDIVADWAAGLEFFKTRDYISDLRIEFLQGGHWLGQDSASFGSVNSITREWLDQKFSTERVVEKGETEL